MELFEKFKKFDQKYALSFFGFWLGLLFGGIGVYTTFFYEKKAALYFETQSNAPVYKINEKIPSLEIKFEGEEINSKKLSLSLLTIKVGNDGSASISKSDYDSEFPVSLAVDAIKIIRYDVLFTSSKYIGDALRISQVSPSKLVLNPIIIDQGQYFILKLLVINSEDTLPRVTSDGKIVGVESIRVFDSAQQNQKSSFIAVAFKGDFTMQITRLICYSFGFILSLFIIIGSIISISEFLSKKKRRRLIKRFTCGLDKEVSPAFKAICGKYVEDGEGFVVFSDFLLSDFELFSKILPRLPLPKLQQYDSSSESVMMDGDGNMLHHSRLGSYADWLLENRIVDKNGDQLVIKDSDARILLGNFVVFLTAHIPEGIKQAKREWKAIESK